MAAKITKKPTAKVTKLTAPKKDGNRFSTTWDVPADAKKTSKNNRFSWVDVEFYLISNVGKIKLIECRKANSWNVLSQLTGHDEVWWRDKGNAWTACTQPFNRNRYHPLVPGKYLMQVYATVHGGNKKGEGPVVRSGTYELKVPRAPSIAEPSLSAETQRLSAAVSADAGTDACERYDTMYAVFRQDNFNAGYEGGALVSEAGGKASWVSTRDAEATPGIDMGDALRLSPDQWVKITFKAYSRGLRGDSPVVERSHVFAHPAQARVTGISVSDLSPTGLVGIAIETNSSTYRPVDRCVLQRLKDTQAATAAAAASQPGWEAVDGQVDNGNCTGFTDAVADAVTLVDEQGNHTGNRTWYRVATYHDNMPPQYSAPVQAEGLYKPAPVAATTKATVKITAASPGGDGTSVRVALSWDAGDGSLFTEVSWSADEGAWESTEPPETFQVTWGESAGGTVTATLDIRGLEPGVPVFIRARRIDAGDVPGPYAKDRATPQSAPANVQLSLPASVARGDDLPLSWTYDGTEQQAWAVYRVESGKRIAILSGSGASASAVIPRRSLPDGDSVSLSVGVSSGGGWAYSDPRAVRVVDAPVLGIEVPSVLAAQPASLVATCSAPGASLVVKVMAEGVSWEAPDGTRLQVPGDVLWSALLAPGWSRSDAGSVTSHRLTGYGEDGGPEYEDAVTEVAAAYSAAIGLPADIEFVDGASYRLTATAVDPSTGLSSDAQVSAFSVRWEHRALAPSEDSAVEPDAPSRTAVIRPAAPDGAADGDVCDIYRVTPIGAALIAESVPFGSAVTDRYAPFSRTAALAYRLATRTADGDTAWTDVGYEMSDEHAILRFDWPGSSLELSRNLSFSSARAKSFEARHHLGGTAPAGFWNPNVSRTATLSSSTLRELDAAELALLEALAAHPGAVFVRTPDGDAYQANVDVPGLETIHGSALRNVTFAITQVELTDEFRCSVEDILLPGSTPEEEEDGEEEE